MTSRPLYFGVAAIGCAVLVAASYSGVADSADAARAGENDIAGVVRSSKGPEAGVWVIAETSELPTRFARIVVTDDQGRYLVPDLPNANYSVWVRGYGLVDSPKVRGMPGKTLDLVAVPAPSEAAAAHYYPAIYWYSMMKLPPNVTNDYLHVVKNRSCVGCHQLGQESTRTIPAAFSHFKSGEEAWMRRVQSGQAGLNMLNPLAQLDGVPYKYF